MISTRTRIATMTGLFMLAAAPVAAEEGPRCAASRLPDQTADAATIKRLEVAWLTAEYRGDTAFLDCLLDAGYGVVRAKTGDVHSKADLLGSFAKNQGSTRAIPPLSSDVVVNGIYATAYSTMKGQKANGDAFEASFVDSYVFRDGHWEAVGGVDF